MCTGLALCTISNRTNVDFDREITRRAQKLALLLLSLTANPGPHPEPSVIPPRTLGHPTLAHNTRLPLDRQAGIQLIWLPSTFYIRIRSNPDAMCRVHGARTRFSGAAVRSQWGGQKRAQNTQKRMELCQTQLARRSPPPIYLA